MEEVPWLPGCSNKHGAGAGELVALSKSGAFASFEKSQKPFVFAAAAALCAAAEIDFAKLHAGVTTVKSLPFEDPIETHHRMALSSPDEALSNAAQQAARASRLMVDASVDSPLALLQSLCQCLKKIFALQPVRLIRIEQTLQIVWSGAAAARRRRNTSSRSSKSSSNSRRRKTAAAQAEAELQRQLQGWSRQSSGGGGKTGRKANTISGNSNSTNSAGTNSRVSRKTSLPHQNTQQILLLLRESTSLQQRQQHERQQQQDQEQQQHGLPACPRK
ncbi:hypothetical protein Emag_006514 [Eimeria magna]